MGWGNTWRRELRFESFFFFLLLIWINVTSFWLVKKMRHSKEGVLNFDGRLPSRGLFGLVPLRYRVFLVVSWVQNFFLVFRSFHLWAFRGSEIFSLGFSVVGFPDFGILGFSVFWLHEKEWQKTEIHKCISSQVFYLKSIYAIVNSVYIRQIQSFNLC